MLESVLSKLIKSSVTSSRKPTNGITPDPPIAALRVQSMSRKAPLGQLHNTSYITDELGRQMGTLYFGDKVFAEIHPGMHKVCNRHAPFYFWYSIPTVNEAEMWADLAEFCTVNGIVLYKDTEIVVYPTRDKCLVCSHPLVSFHKDRAHLTQAVCLADGVWHRYHVSSAGVLEYYAREAMFDVSSVAPRDIVRAKTASDPVTSDGATLVRMTEIKNDLAILRALPLIED